MGRPLHLGAYGVGEVRGDHYYLATAGFLRELGRMPDFLGGVILDTLVGPVLIAASADFNGSWRTYIGVGRLFR